MGRGQALNNIDWSQYSRAMLSVMIPTSNNIVQQRRGPTLVNSMSNELSNPASYVYTKREL